MKMMIFVVAVLWSFIPSNAQDLIDGERLDGIQIGKSTVYDVISNYGTDYKLKKNTDYSNALVFEKLGLSFYSCQSDSKQEIFAILIQSPFSVQTSKGIILGKSTFRDLFKVYGKWRKNSAGFEYEKIGFYFDSEIETFSDFEPDNMNFAQSKKVVSENNSKVIDYSNSTDNSISTSPNSTNVLNDNTVKLNNSARSNQLNNPSINQNKVLNNKSRLSRNNSNDEETEFKSELEKWGNEIVKKIELIEKGRLRQCHIDFADRNK